MIGPSPTPKKPPRRPPNPARPARPAAHNRRPPLRSWPVPPGPVDTLSIMLSPKSPRFAAIALAAWATPALAQDYDFSWATIGAPGNRATRPDETPWDPGLPLGAVGYEYRLSRTELTVRQQLEFLNAAWRHYPGDPRGTEFTGFWIRPTNNTPGQDPGYVILPGAENRPAEMSWFTAARYCNWLHSGKASSPQAIETGVYDMASYTRNPDGTWNGQDARSPDARFWIPSLDEWVKGMYYDPDKLGPGQEGYWHYPHASDSPPAPGWPWEGGQTSAGIPYDIDGPWLDVGMYPHAQSPWGLLDGSGSEVEWLEDWTADRRDRLAKGSAQFTGPIEALDPLDRYTARSPHNGGFGLRLASAVPTPGSGCLVLTGVLYLLRRRR